VAGASVLVIMMLSGLVVTGALVAVADTVALLVGSGYPSGTWAPPSADPSGAAWIDSDGYLLVVDTNVNNPSSNGWAFDIQTGEATSRGTGVVEPTGVDYDSATDTLFVSQDDGHIFVFTDFDEPAQQMITIDVSPSFDTEDPVYNPDNGRLYWVDGGGDALYELIPQGPWGGGDDTINSFSLSGLNPSEDSDWEGLALDPTTGNLLIANTLDLVIYEVGFNGDEVATSSGQIFSHSTINAESISGLTKISGMGVAPSSFPAGGWTLWVSDRNSSSLFELTYDGTVPPTTTTTTTGQATTSTSPTTTTPGATTTTSTTPGATTTTTTPGNPPPDPDPDLGFVDIAGSGFANAIQWLADEGITKGCNPPANTMFCPDDFVTRGQMATFLVRAFGYSDNGGGNLFIDDNSSVFEGAIDKLAQAGITVGCNPPLNNRFCPDDLVTRGQMAAFLGRAFGYTNDGGGNWFVDDNGSVFESAIDRLRTAGVTQGCNPPLNNRYCPNDFVTRGQMAAFLKRALGA